MRDFSKEVAENKNLENSIEVAKTLRDKSLCEMAKDVYDILNEIYTDGTKFITYRDYYDFPNDSELGKLGIKSFFFRKDSNGRFIKFNDIKIDYEFGGDYLCFNGTYINVTKDAFVVKNADGTSVADWKLKQFFNEMNIILKVGKENWLELAEHIIQKRLEKQKKDLQDKFNEVSCSVSK